MKKRNIINSSLVFFVIFTSSVFIISETLLSQNVWEVPAEFVNMKNEKAGEKDADEIGKSLYNTHCKVCHGRNGDGEGQKMQGLEIEILSFSDPTFQSQSDGEIYYKIFNGRGIMPSFRKKIVESEDRWLLVNYLRAFKN